jgi:hypothetical protein
VAWVIVKIIVDDGDDTTDGPETDFNEAAAEIESRRESETKQRGIVGVNEDFEDYFDDCG